MPRGSTTIWADPNATYAKGHAGYADIFSTDAKLFRRAYTNDAGAAADSGARAERARRSGRLPSGGTVARLPPATGARLRELPARRVCPFRPRAQGRPADAGAAAD